MDHAGLYQDGKDLEELREIAKLIKPLTRPEYWYSHQLDHAPDEVVRGLNMLRDHKLP